MPPAEAEAGAAATFADTTVVAGRDDGADSDSLDDAYGDEEHHTNAADHVEPEASTDDYARTFDSPERDLVEVPDHVAEKPESLHAVVPPGEVPTTPSSTAIPPTLPLESASAEVAPLSKPEAVPSLQPASIQPDSIYEANRTTTPDIHRLLADLTSQTDQPIISNPPSSSQTPGSHPQPSNPVASPSVSLPPRSDMLQPMPQSYHHSEHPPSQDGQQNVSPAIIAPPTSVQPTYMAAAPPGTSPEDFISLSQSPVAGSNVPPPHASMSGSQYQPDRPPFAAANKKSDPDYQRMWDQFMVDERRYMTEANWERFPEGSRIFIGNLSSDKVSKRDVFNLFHKYGRLAQISLKSAYGFVQYHNLEDAAAAMENLQGAEIRGRKIHLEISRAQDKKKKTGEREKSPRAKDLGQRHDRNNQNRQSRDDYRPGRNNSPRHSDYYGRDYGRDRGFHDEQSRSRGRSRSPPAYGRHEHESYRRRSPSPYGRSKSDADRLDIPRRYGSQVPDVQLLLLQELGREFVAWVERAFTDRGLKTEVMFLNPSFPRESVIQRQASEGVHAVVELDMMAHTYGKISLQVFDRSGGPANIRFDRYQDLEPMIAAELVVRAKDQAQAQQGQHQSNYPPASYVPPFGVPPAHQTQASPHTPTFPSGPPSAPPVNPADIAKMIGSVDNATLQRLLSSLQGQAGGSVPFTGTGALPGVPPSQAPDVNAAAGAASSHIDLQAIFGNLQNAATGNPSPTSGQPTGYGLPLAYSQAPVAPNGAAAVAPGTANTSAQVQNIMAQLARYRQ